MYAVLLKRLSAPLPPQYSAEFPEQVIVQPVYPTAEELASSLLQ
jgi:hypothetical protein